MNTKDTIVIIDYGLGNLFSLSNALRRFVARVVISNDPVVISSADKIILPGVGAFAEGMKGLREKKLVDIVRTFATSGKPILGVCLGAQLLLDEGYEYGKHEGLGVIPGAVREFSSEVILRHKIPHIGWNSITTDCMVNWAGTILSGTNDMSNVYFVHSYIMIPKNRDHILATAQYGGVDFCAVVRNGNVYGTQFHLEKSGEVGLEIIRNFVLI